MKTSRRRNLHVQEWARWQYKRRRRKLVKGVMPYTEADKEIRQRRLRMKGK